jgi:hypothetical protein
MTASSFGPKNEPIFADGDAPDVAVNATQAAAYAAKVGNRRVGTTAERDEAATNPREVWEGLLWFDTTLDTEFLWMGIWIRVGGVWATFTPTTAGLVASTVMYAKLKVSDGECAVRTGFLLGTGGSWSDPTVGFPIAIASWLSNLAPIGQVTLYDQSAGVSGRFAGPVYKTAAGARLLSLQPAGAGVLQAVNTGSQPFTAVAGDEIHAEFRFPII